MQRLKLAYPASTLAAGCFSSSCLLGHLLTLHAACAASVYLQDKLLVVDDVFDSGNTIKAVIDTIRAKARR